jgi:hypothetical protein
MKIKLVSRSNGVYVFDIAEAGSIRNVTVPRDRKRGDLFNIYFGDGSHIPYKTEKAVWLGLESGKKPLTSDMEMSIRKSDVFIGESIDSDAFYDKIVRKYCVCHCRDPSMKTLVTEVFAVDLAYPDYARSRSRCIVYKGKCAICSEDLTCMTNLGGFNTTGLDNFKQLIKESGSSIDWNTVITSIEDI